MSFNLMGFVLGRALAQNRGITDSGAINRAGLMLGVTGLNAVGLVVATQVIDDASPQTVIVPLPVKRDLASAQPGDPGGLPAQGAAEVPVNGNVAAASTKSGRATHQSPG